MQLTFTPDLGGSMTLDEAVEAVRRTLTSELLIVDRRLAQHDQSDYLILVLDGRRDFDDGEVPIENGPRLVSKEDGVVTRLTVPAAVARARSMVLVQA
jgi:hypothetical protein